jgi:hypothetical protein
MNDVDLGLGLDLDIRFFADGQVLKLEQCGLSSFHARYQPLNLLVFVPDVVLCLLTLIKVRCAVVWGELLLDDRVVLLWDLFLWCLSL